MDALGRASKTFVNGVFKNEIYYYPSGLVQYQTHLPGNLMSMMYDGSPLHRLIKTTYPGGAAVTQTYGSEGQYYKTTTTDENGHSTTNIVDLLGRPYKIRNALGGETIWQYDDRNNNTLIISPKAAGNPNANVLNYHFNYDNRNRLVSKYVPGMDLGSLQTFTYYDGSNPSSPGTIIHNNLLKTSTDPNGTVLYHEYDLFGRPKLSKKGGSNGVIISQNRYDNQGISSNPINIGRLNQSQTLILDDLETSYLTTNYSYDIYGRLAQTTKANHLGGQDQIITTYNDADWMTQSQRLHQSNATYGNENLNILQNYEYDNFGRPTKNTYHINGTTRTLLLKGGTTETNW